MRIALLENDSGHAEQVCAALKAIGHACRQLDARVTQEHLQGDDIDLLILDMKSASESGLDQMRELRASLPDSVPVLLLAGRSDEDCIAAAMEAGASDYLVKPIRLSELATRVRVLLKRAYPAQSLGEQVGFGPYVFETASGRLTISGKPIDATQKEFELALLFFRNLGRPLSRATILEAIWPGEPNIVSRTMDTHVSRIRSKLNLRPENGFRLAPVYSYGYQLEQVGK